MNYKKQFSVFMFGIVITTSLFVTNQAQAEIFKCVNQQGAVYYNDKPCPKKDTETQIKNTKDPKGVTTNFQASSYLQVDVDENLTNKELSNLRSQQRFDYIREKSGASDDDVTPLSEGSDPLEL